MFGVIPDYPWQTDVTFGFGHFARDANDRSVLGIDRSAADSSQVLTEMLNSSGTASTKINIALLGEGTPVGVEPAVLIGFATFVLVLIVIASFQAFGR
jgi:hypothetical protein